MRSTLTLLLLCIVIAVAFMIQSATAGEVNWSAGVTLTEKEAGVSMGSRLAAVRVETNSFGRAREHVIASWFSVTSMLPELLFGKTIAYDTMVDFANIRSIERVVVSPDSGLTEWEAIQVPLWGWIARLGEMPPGPHALSWGVYSRDKKNRLVLFIIPINWSSGRTSSVVQQINVLRTPVGCESYSDEQWLALLRGFRSVDAKIDPQFMAQQQMFGSQPQQVTEPSVPSTPPPPVNSEPKGSKKPLPPREEDMEESSANFEGEATLVLTGQERITEFPLVFDKPVRITVGDIFTFRRNGKFVAEAEVTEVIPGRVVEARIVRGGGVRPQDQIFLNGGK